MFLCLQITLSEALAAQEIRKNQIIPEIKIIPQRVLMKAKP